MAIPALSPGVPFQRCLAKCAHPDPKQRDRMPSGAERDVGGPLGLDDPPTETPECLPADHESFDEKEEPVPAVRKHQPSLG